MAMAAVVKMNRRDGSRRNMMKGGWVTKGMCAYRLLLSTVGGNWMRNVVL